jgi:hypothetical protein
MVSGEETTERDTAMSGTPTEGYLARAKRIDDAMNLRKPDRVPVAPLVVGFFPTRSKGISNRDAMHSMDRTFNAWKEAAVEYGWDAAPSPGGLYAARPLEILGLKQLKWPGNGLPDDQPFQWVEGEYMMQDEYDQALADPNGYAVQKVWPRISSTLGSLSAMAQMPSPPLLFLSASPVIQAFLGEMLSSPPMLELLKKALELAEAHTQVKQQTIDYVADVTKSGYPVLFNSASVTAYDWISDAFRGMKGSMLDMYKVPDKLLAMVEMFIPLSIGGSLMMAQREVGGGVFIPMHRGAAGFMNDKQFAKFYWPGFKALINGIVEAGLIPVPFFEGDYTQRLEYLQELPAKKVMAHFDVVDRRKAKKLLGDRMVFWGNVPASLMCAGTPQQVKDDVKELIDIFGDNGGLIIDASTGIPDEARPENIRALTEAVYEYGVY